MATGQNLQFPTDRVLERLANRVVIEADREFGMHQKELAAAVKQRIRLAHALHEGLLQSLTGAALQLEATWHLVDTDPRRGRELVREIQELLLERQRELREWVEAANDGELDPSDACSDLRDALRTLCGRLTRWGPRVELRVSDLERMPTPMHDCVYRLVEEALSNAARHAHANAASVDVHVRQEHVALTIEDDGCGFPIYGRYDLAALDAGRQGPRWLMQTVATHAGDLVLTSSRSGCRIDMRLPVQGDYATASKLAS